MQRRSRVQIDERRAADRHERLSPSSDDGEPHISCADGPLEVDVPAASLVKPEFRTPLITGAIVAASAVWFGSEHQGARLLVRGRVGDPQVALAGHPPDDLEFVALTDRASMCRKEKTVDRCICRHSVYLRRVGRDDRRSTPGRRCDGGSTRCWLRRLHRRRRYRFWAWRGRRHRAVATGSAHHDGQCDGDNSPADHRARLSGVCVFCKRIGGPTRSI